MVVDAGPRSPNATRAGLVESTVTCNAAGIKAAVAFGVPILCFAVLSAILAPVDPSRGEFVLTPGFILDHLRTYFLQVSANWF